MTRTIHVLLYMCLIAAASETAAAAANCPSTVMFGNGIYVEDPDWSARILTAAVRSKLGTESSKLPRECFGVAKATERYDDILEAINQGLGADFRVVWRGLFGSSTLAKDFEDAIADLIFTDPTDTTSKNDLATHITAYETILASSASKIVVVAHSQGNFFVNEAFRQLVERPAPIDQSRFDVIAVASPAPWTVKGAPHITLYGDIILSVATLLANTKQTGTPCNANPLNPEGLPGIIDAVDCHLFTTSYMAGLESKPAIVDSVIGALVLSVPTARPLLSAIPLDAAASSQKRDVTFKGSNFQDGLSILVTLPTLQTVTVSGQDIQDVAPTTIQALVTLPVAGVYTFRIRNPDGGESDGYSIQVRPASPLNAPPIAGFTMTADGRSVAAPTELFVPTDPSTGEGRVTLVSTSTDPDGDAIRWSWGVNTQAAPLCIDTATCVWGFQPGGPYIVTLTVTDSAGHSSQKTGTIYVTPPTCVPPPANLVAWWPGEASGADLVGPNAGVLVGGAAVDTGMVGSALSLDGATGHFRIAHDPRLDFTNAMTAEAWVHPSSLDGRLSTIVAKWDAVAINQRSYAFYLDPDGRLYFRVSPNGLEPGFPNNSLGAVVSNGTVSLSQWSHVAAVYDGQFLKLYINGDLDSQVAYNLDVFPGVEDTAIGAVVGGVAVGQSISQFEGLIDEVGLYNRGLSSTEITAIFNAGSAGKCATSLPPTLTGIVSGPIVAGPQDQIVRFSGTRFQQGLTMSVVLPGGSTSTLSGIQIAAVTPTSIEALVTFGSPGRYTFTSINPDGGTSAPLPTIALGALPTLTQLPNTGMSSSGQPDPYYTLVSSPTCPSGACEVFTAGGDSTSAFLTPDNTGNQPGGQYIYRLAFTVSEAEAPLARVTGRWATDDAGADILINGQRTGLRTVQFGEFSPFAIAAGFRSGVNTLDFLVNNQDCGPACTGNPVQLRVELAGSATLDPPNAARDDSYTMLQGTTLAIKAPGVLANDSPLSLRFNSVSTAFVSTPPGLFEDLSGGNYGDLSGGFRYTPDPAFTGDVSFTYQFSTNTGVSNLAKVTVHVAGCPTVSEPLFEVIASLPWSDPFWPSPDFAGWSTNGALTSGGSGKLYALQTPYGHSLSAGRVVSIEPATGALSILHDFVRATEGASPEGSLLLAADGFFYGTLQEAGLAGGGSVFRMDAAGGVMPLYSFSSESGEGYAPSGGLAMGPDGRLYGTTSLGGPSGQGTIFALARDGRLSTVHAFASADGDAPISGIMLADDGFLYGVTARGPNGTGGMVFRVGLDGQLTVIHSFAVGEGSPDSVNPLMQASDGRLYGVADSAVFRVDPVFATFELLHSFNSEDGLSVQGTLVEGDDGALYGTAIPTRSDAQTGFVFRITQGGATTIVKALNESDGTWPWAGLTKVGGVLYGATTSGGGNGNGTVFQLIIPFACRID